MTHSLKLKGLDYATALSFAVYAASATVTPICLVKLAQELDFSLVGGGAIEAVRTALLFVALLGSGWAAAHFGKAICLGISSLLLAVGLAVYAIAPVYGLVLLAVAVAGIGAGVIEALLNPLIQDLHPGDSGRYLNFLNAFFPVGVLLVVLGGGEWLTREGSWRVIMLVLSLLCVLSGALFLMFSRIATLPASHGAESVLSHKRAVLGHPRFWLFAFMMFLGGGAEGGLTFWSASYIQLHFDATPRMGGIGTAAFALGMILGRIVSGWHIPQHRLPYLIAGSALLGFPVCLSLPLLPGLRPLMIALFIAGLTIACFWPSLQSYAADRMPLETTALFILLSCGGMAGFGSTSWLMGVIGEYFGLNASLYIVPLYLFALAACIYIERKTKVKHG